MKDNNMNTKNLCGKTRDRSQPYEVWQSFNGEWTWAVLKKWQSPDKESKNEYARWFCFVKSPFCPQGELGDVYCQEIKSQARKISG
jgi:hypothetical protein